MADTQKLLALYAFTFSEDGYPPVAGKILGLFHISNQKYLTFDEIKEQISASKSATSKALNLLMDMGDVGFTTFKEHKRKRYFFLDIEGGIAHLQKLIKAYTLQNEVLEETLEHRDDSNPEMNRYIEKTIIFSQEVIEFIEEKIHEHYNEFLNKEDGT